MHSIDIVELLLRVILGLFFVIYRFRWIYDPTSGTMPWLNTVRHQHLAAKLCSCGWGMHPLLAAFVALIENFAGLGVMFGLFTQLSAFGLMSILIVATTCTAKHKIEIQNGGKGPEDSIDVVSCYLWTVEPVYIVIAFCVLLLGPGRYSIDALLQVI